jgi:hypothetical protein
MAVDFASLLTDRLNAASNGGELPSIQQLVSEYAAADPRMAAVAKYIALRQSHVTETEESAGEPQIPLETYQKIKAIRQELDQLRQRNDALAGALGACYLCWGTQVTCPICHGRGSPGAYQSDRALFDEFVAPVLPQFQLAQSTRTHADEHHGEDGQEPKEVTHG